MDSASAVAALWNSVLWVTSVNKKSQRLPKNCINVFPSVTFVGFFKVISLWRNCITTVVLTVVNTGGFGFVFEWTNSTVSYRGPMW